MADVSIEELIEKITERVAARLKESGIKPSKDGPAVICPVGKDACIYCGLCTVKATKAVENIVGEGAVRIGAGPGVGVAGIDSRLASMIDHTILKPGATREELIRVCDEAKKFGFATVCVNSSNIPLVAQRLKGSNVKPIAVVGFPLGAMTPIAKAFEAREAISNGAREVDMVINIGAMKSKDYKLVHDDIKGVVDASKPYPVKVIIETGELDNEEKIAACVLSKTGGAAFVKTSTGFAKGGATVEDIALIRKIIGSDMAIKASGGIRTKEDAEALVKAGANRIGASASVAIVTGKKDGKGGY